MVNTVPKYRICVKYRYGVHLRNFFFKNDLGVCLLELVH